MGTLSKLHVAGSRAGEVLLCVYNHFTRRGCQKAHQPFDSKTIQPFSHPAIYLWMTTQESPEYQAFFSASIFSFFIFSSAAVTRSAFSGLFISWERIAGTICHEMPNGSLSQPHCSASGWPESFSQ